MPELLWRTPTDVERDLAQRWIAAWNEATGDSAALPEAFQAADSCTCGTCPSFAVGPVTLTAPERESRPLSIEGEATTASGDQAGLIAFWSEDVLDLELFPFLDRPITDLATLTVTLHRSGQ